MNHILIALMLFAALPGVAQNVVLNDSPNYAAFRLNGDTLDTSQIPAFLAFMSIGDAAEQDTAQAAVITFLKNNPTNVDKLNLIMQQTLHVSLEDYACFFRLQEKRVRIIATRN